MVIYTGKETRMAMNLNEPRTKVNIIYINLYIYSNTYILLNLWGNFKKKKYKNIFFI